MNDKIILLSIDKEELAELVKEAVRSEINKRKEKELINSKELIDWLGISLSTLNTWKRENKIPYHRLGRRIYFKRTEVIEALQSSRYEKFRELQ